MEKPQFPIKAGQRFMISTMSYSDRTEHAVTALKDIEHKDLIEMARRFEAFNEQTTGWKTFGYEQITAYLVAFGFVSEPEFLPYLDFGYSPLIEEKSFLFYPYEKENYEESLIFVKENLK
jgi:hypothetical protein